MTCRPSVITLSVGESFGFHHSYGGTTIDPANELREEVFARVRSSSVERAPCEADLSRDVKGLGARRCGSVGIDLPMPHSVLELDGLGALETIEVKTIPLKSSFQLVAELVVAQRSFLQRDLSLHDSTSVRIYT